MNGQTIIFYLLAAFTIVSGILSVTTRQIFRAAIFLLFTLIGIAGLYFWMSYNFIAAVQIVVYVGGITVLIIFSIFLTQQAGERLPSFPVMRQVFAALASFCGFALLIWQLSANDFAVSADTNAEPPITTIGQQMLGTTKYGYALPFELISILLLAALIGCVVIALRSKPSPI